MKLKLKPLSGSFRQYGIALGIMIIGILLAWYGFELVSIPHIREYHEIIYIALGLVCMAGGLVFAVMGRKLPGPTKAVASSPE